MKPTPEAEFGRLQYVYIDAHIIVARAQARLRNGIKAHPGEAHRLEPLLADLGEWQGKLKAAREGAGL